ncbi:ROK family glucokinase [Ferviditalea candida]|uniref:Glucokinase n=1 Tax=Ferviditalea candida TaxID=3108399 RepID=A0ABU5ZLV8_9BACL|nr:ROK family glucokinase [Paenibacillaceae bacterium T2]
MSNENEIFVGVDLGGTSIKIGLCDKNGRLLHKMEGPTETERGVDHVIDTIAVYARRIVADSYLSWDQVAGIGIGIPGFTDIPDGIVILAPNLHWHNVPVRGMLEEKLGKKVVIDNDANAAALGELWSGAGKDIDNVVCYTLGTGVGGGIIVNGKIYRGFSGVAGELGHMQVVPDLEAIQCGCGQMGCLETVASATGIIRMARDAVERGEHTPLSLLDRLSAKNVLDTAKSGDEVALRIVNRAARYLGKSMALIAVVINPQRFIVGGGVSLAGEILLQPAREAFEQFTPEPAREGVEIVTALLGNDAGMVGAAGLLLKG